MPSSSQRDDSAAAAFLASFSSLPAAAAIRVALAVWDQLPIVEQAAIAADWSFWARSKQMPPVTRWLTWGFLTGRGFGKTVAIAHYLVGEIEAGRVRRLCLLAQDEQSAIDIQVLGPSGIIAVSPPWFRPTWESSALRIVWPNGVEAYVRTPEVPGKIRGLEYSHTWASELQSWPKSTREEAWHNGVEVSTRLDPCQIVWDSTPKKRHPILKMLLAQAEAAPERHVVVRGSMRENASNLGDGYVDEIERKFLGTSRWREEGLGEMLDDADGALWRQAWIDANRRDMPAKILRRVVSIDPAVSDRPGSDNTGIIEAALGDDGRGYVLLDESGKYKPEQWAKIVLDIYQRNACDLIIAETNKGGALVSQNVRAAAKERGLEVVVLERGQRCPPKQPGKVFIKEVYARGEKADRAEPVATAYERNRVSHVRGCNLSSLEDTLTAWEPAPHADSPGDLDALVHALVDLLGLGKEQPDLRKGFDGLAEANRVLAVPHTAAPIGFATVHSRHDAVD